jgi:hypothetical protein
MCGYSLEHYRSRPAQLAEKIPNASVQHQVLLRRVIPRLRFAWACDIKLRREERAHYQAEWQRATS